MYINNICPIFPVCTIIIVVAANWPIYKVAWPQWVISNKRTNRIDGLS